MRRFPISVTVFCILFAAALLVCGAGLYVNARLARSKALVERSARRIPGVQLAISSVYYLPPNIVVFQGIHFSGPRAQSLLRVAHAYFKISLRDLLKKRKLVVSDIICDNPKIYDPQFYQFLMEHGRELIDLIIALPQQDIRMEIVNASLNDAGCIRTGRNFSTDCDLSLSRGHISVTGRLYEERPAYCMGSRNPSACISRRLPVEYRLSGELGPAELMVEGLEMSRENFYAKLWGSVRGAKVMAQGFSFVNTSFVEREYVKRQGKPWLGILPRLFLGSPKLEALPSLKMSDVDLYLLDIDGIITLQIPLVSIERLNLSVDNIPLNIKGTARLEKPGMYDLAVVSDMQNHADKRLQHIRKVSLNIAGTLADQYAAGSGFLQVSYGKAGNEEYPYQRADVRFKELSVDWKAFPYFRAAAGELGFVCATGSNSYEIPLRSANVAVRLDKKKSLVIGARGLFHDGIFTAKGRIDASDLPLKVSAMMRVRGVSAENLSGLVVHFSKVRGKVFSQMWFGNHPANIIKGGMSIVSGSLREFDFLKWLSDLIGLNQLRVLAFNRAVAYFAVDETSARLQKIILMSPDISLKGDYTLGKKDMVSSKLSLQLSRGLLSRSEKFRPLIKMLPDTAEPVRFDFQLSGSLHAMNFQWLDSSLKQQIEVSMPGFVERHIEKSVETMIDEAARSD